jgi:outer membrane receptor protein involved in Fe transport
LAAFVLFGHPSVFAQQAASISGIITDPAGHVVAEATLTLIATETAVVHVTVSNGSGAYTFVNIRPAQYTLKVAKEGFTSILRPMFDLAVNQTATYDFQLAIGSKHDIITVVATPDIESSTAELGSVIAQKSVNELPLNGRNFTGLLALSPGVSPISVAQNATGGSGFAGNAIGSFSFPAVNGQRNRSNRFLLDGSNDLGSFLGNYNFAPIIDTVQEFKVQSHNDEAEFGQALGGIVNVVSKSGTNEYHGSLWEFLRNERFDARSFFAGARNPLRQNQFGVSGGGPVRVPGIYDGKNKTFFFGGYEGYRQSQASSTPLLVPTQQQVSGNFSGDGTTIYNPFTTRSDPSNPGSYLRTPFAGNIIPKSMLDPAALEWATLFPAPGGAQVAGYNLTDLTPQRTNQDSYQMRVDQAFGDRDVLFSRVSYYSQNSSNSGGFPGAVAGVNIGGWNWTANEIHTFSPSAVLDLHLARNQGNDLNTTTFPNAPPQIGADLLASGFASNFISNYQAGKGPYIPVVAISGFASAGQQVQGTSLADTWQFGGNFTKITGRHTLKVGVDAATNNGLSSVYRSSVSFTSFETANLEGAGGTGNALASFLLGVPDSAQRIDAIAPTHGGWVDGGYIQDQWRVNNRLTLNVGLRWDVTLFPIIGPRGTPGSFVGDLDLNNGTYLLTAVPPACSRTVGIPCIPGGALPANVVVTDQSNGAIFHNSYGDWQGRFGVGYRLTDRITLRGGYGRFYDSWNSVIQLAQNYAGSWPNAAALTASNLNHTIPTAGIGDPLNLGSGSAQQLAPTPFSQVAFFADPTDYKLPYSDQWNFGIDQSAGKNTVISVAYVGAHSLQLDVGGFRNVAQTPGPGDAATVASRRPYPYITPTFYDQSIGQSTFHALEIRLERRAAAGLTYLLSYTWSKSMDDACSGSFGVEGCGLQDPYHISADRSLSGFDIPQNFAASWNWQLPFGKGKRFHSQSSVVNLLTGEWQLNGILSLHSGVPFDVTVNGDIANTGNNYDRADLVLANPYPSNKGPTAWLNPAAFAVPTNYTFGDLGRNSLRTAATRTLDLSTFRRFPVKDRFAFEFRTEVFNLTNTPVFGQPNSVVNAPNFGVISSTRNTPREIQFALKAIF